MDTKEEIEIISTRITNIAIIPMGSMTREGEVIRTITTQTSRRAKTIQRKSLDKGSKKISTPLNLFLIKRRMTNTLKLLRILKIVNLKVLLTPIGK